MADEIKKPVPAETKKPEPVKPAPAIKAPVFDTRLWKSAKQNKPEIKDRQSAVTRISRQLLLHVEGKKHAVPGYYVQYSTDVNAPHQEPVKKGDTYYVDMLGNRLDDVLSFYPIDEIPVRKV